MKESKQAPRRGRRAFLASAVGAGGAAAVLAASGEAAVQQPASRTQEAARSPGYQETEHVREYYKTARI